MLLMLLLLAFQFDPKYSPKFAEASRAVEKQDYPRAQDLLLELTREQPEVGDYWHLLGVSRAAAGDLAGAEPALARACRSPQKPAQACYQWGRVLQSINRHDDALAAFAAAPRGGIDAATQSARAISLEALGQYEQADQAYRAALAESALRPRNSAEIQHSYAQFLIRQGKFEPALWQLRQALRKQPFAGEIWRDQALVLIQLERFEEAIDSLEQAIAHGQRNSKLLLLLSELHARSGNEAKAAAYRREATPIDP